MGKARKKQATGIVRIGTVLGTPIARVRLAVRANCGGWLDATDGEFAAKWRQLDDETRAAYLASVEEVPASDPVAAETRAEGAGS